MVSIARQYVSAEAKYSFPNLDGKDDSETAQNDNSTPPLSNLEIESEVLYFRTKQVHNETKDSKELHKLCRLRLGHTLPTKCVRSFVESGELHHVKCVRIDCEECTQGKFKRCYGGSITREDRPDVLHVETKREVDTQFVDGHNYFLKIVEEYARFTCARPTQ